MYLPPPPGCPPKPLATVHDETLLRSSRPSASAHENTVIRERRKNKRPQLPQTLFLKPQLRPKRTSPFRLRRNGLIQALRDLERRRILRHVGANRLLGRGELHARLRLRRAQRFLLLSFILSKVRI